MEIGSIRSGFKFIQGIELLTPLYYAAILDSGHIIISYYESGPACNMAIENTMIFPVSRHRRALNLLVACIFCQFYGAGLLAEETGILMADIQAVEVVEPRLSALSDSTVFSPVDLPAQAMVATNESELSESGALQDQAGMCLVVEGLIGDFCAQYPEDSGCQAIQQLNSQ